MLEFDIKEELIQATEIMHCSRYSYQLINSNNNISVVNLMMLMSHKFDVAPSAPIETPRLQTEERGWPVRGLSAATPLPTSGPLCPGIKMRHARPSEVPPAVNRARD